MELPSFKDLDLTKLELRDNGASRQGGKLVMPLLGSDRLRCNLTPRGFLKAPFGFDLSGKYEKPSFLTGAAAGKSESLNLVLELGAEQAEFLQRVDSFFQARYGELEGKSQWYELVKSSKYGSNAKVKVVLEGMGLTQLKVLGVDQKMHTGYGWRFLQERLAENCNFRRGRCKVSLCLSNLWCVSGKAGVTLTATHLVLAAAEGPEEAEDECYDDEELLAEFRDFSFLGQ